MPDGSVPLLIALVVLILFSAFFSMTETAYSCANRIKLRALASNGNVKAQKVLTLAEKDYDRLISTILIGNNIVNIVATTIATILFAMVYVNNPATGNVVSTVVMTLSVLIFGEITPKLIAKTYPEKLSMLVYPLIKFFYYILFLLNLIFSGWKWIISKIFRFKDDDVVTEAEIMTMVEEAEEDGTLKTEETELIRSVIEFDDLEVGDILVPRVNIVAVDVTSSMDEIKKVFAKEGYSRIPVYRESVDTIIGTIHEKDFYNAYLQGKKGIDGIMQNALYTTEHAKISDLLRQLQKKKMHIAVVLDEYGGTLGLLTMEDILEELVGDIMDEHDVAEAQEIQKVSDCICEFDGKVLIEDAYECMELPCCERDESTIGGYVFTLLGRAPKVGDKVEDEYCKYEVISSNKMRIKRVRVQIKEQEQTPED